MWVLYSLAASGLTSVLPIINKRLLTDTDVSVVAWADNAFSLPILGAAALLVAPTFTKVDALFWLGVLGSGALNMAATLISTQALKLEDASLVTPFLTFNPLFTLLIADATLGEAPSPGGIIGVMLIVLGGYLFAIEDFRIGPFSPIRALLSRPGIVLAILASFVWGVTPIFEKIAIQHSFPENPPLVAFASTGIMSLLLLPLMLLGSKRPFRQISQRRRGFFLAALIAGVAPVFGFTAIAQGYVGYVSALFKLSPIFTVLLAAAFLHEGGIRERLLGSVVMAAGAVIVAL